MFCELQRDTTDKTKRMGLMSQLLHNRICHLCKNSFEAGDDVTEVYTISIGRTGLTFINEGSGLDRRFIHLSCPKEVTDASST